MIANTSETRAEYQHVWVVAEVLGGEIQKVTYELLGAARSLAEARKSEVWCVVLGHGVTAQSESLFHGGADVALVVDDEDFAEFVDEDQADVLTRLIREHKPEIVLCGATTRGRALIPRVAVVANCGLTADCTELGIDPENGDLLQTRPAFGGNIMATIRSADHRPQLATVRPRVMNELEPDTSRKGRLIEESVRPGERSGLKKILEVFTDTENAINLADARFIIAGGRGLRGPEGQGPGRARARCGGREPRRGGLRVGTLLPPGGPDGPDGTGHRLLRLRDLRADSAPGGNAVL